jgi:hypothetical protein
MKTTLSLRVALCSLIPEAFAVTPDDGSVLEHFRRITDTDTQYRMALQRQQLMREQDAQTRKPEAQA